MKLQYNKDIARKFKSHILGEDICKKCNERIHTWNLKISPTDRKAGGEGGREGRKVKGYGQFIEEKMYIVSEHEESCLVFLVIRNAS